MSGHTRSYIYGPEIKSGNTLWSKPLQVKSPLIKEQRAGGRIFIVSKDKIIGIYTQNGEIVVVRCRGPPVLRVESRRVGFLVSLCHVAMFMSTSIHCKTLLLLKCDICS
jgi:hypothetical protein